MGVSRRPEDSELPRCDAGSRAKRNLGLILPLLFPISPRWPPPHLRPTALQPRRSGFRQAMCVRLKSEPWSLTAAMLMPVLERRAFKAPNVWPKRWDKTDIG